MKEVSCHICHTTIIILESGSKMKIDTVSYCKSCHHTIDNVLKLIGNNSSSKRSKNPFGDFGAPGDYDDIFSKIFKK